MRSTVLGLITLVTLFAGWSATSDDVFRIEVGRDYNKYSDRDQKRRIWELERAVEQLQARVFNLEAKPVVIAAPPADSWACTVKAMGNTYTGTGPNKALASTRALENCKAGQKGDAFFCKSPECEN